jgi:sporulation protein YlmC with PRC-barrel domain
MRLNKASRWGRVTLLPAFAAAISLTAQAQAPAQPQGGSAAQPQAQAQPHAQAQSPGARNQAYKPLRASEVIGMNVRDAAGERVGEIRDAVVNMNTGELQYVVLGFSPGFFQSERVVALPPRQLRLNAQDQHFVFDVDRERLEQVSIPTNEWSEQFVGNRERMGFLERMWATQPAPPDHQFRRASDLLNRDVQARDGRRMGNIEELVLDLNNQRVHYAVVEMDRGWFEQDKRVSFPVSAFVRDPNVQALVLDMDRQAIQGMAGLGADHYDRLDQMSGLEQDTRILGAGPGSGPQGGPAAATGERAGTGTPNMRSPGEPGSPAAPTQGQGQPR